MAYAAPSPPAQSFRAANLGCFAAMAMWAAGFPAAEVLLEDWGVLALIAARMAVAAVLFLIAWWAIEGWGAIRAAAWWTGVWIGGLGFGVGATLLLAGQALSDPVTTAIAATTTPIVGAVLEIIFDKRRPTAPLITGVALALVGGVIATGLGPENSALGVGAAVCILSVVIYSWGTRAAVRQMAGTSALGVAAVTTVGAVAIISPALLVVASFGHGAAGFGAMGLTPLLLFLVYVIPGYLLSQTLWLWSVGRMGILLSSLHMNAMPFYVMIAGVLALGAEFSTRQAAGAGLVALGVIVAQMKTARA